MISRIRKEGLLVDILADVAFEALTTGPWRHLNIWPEWEELKKLAKKWPLRGTNLWHLATAKTLKMYLPELNFLTFDPELRTAADEEELIHY